jgi:hypothetical protein
MVLMLRRGRVAQQKRAKRAVQAHKQLKSNNDIKTLGLNEEIDLIRISEEGDIGWKQLELITGIVFDNESRS